MNVLVSVDETPTFYIEINKKTTVGKSYKLIFNCN